MDIFIWRDNQELGPLSRGEIFSRLVRGELGNDDPARTAEDAEWRPLSEVLKGRAPSFSVPGFTPVPPRPPDPAESIAERLGSDEPAIPFEVPEGIAESQEFFVWRNEGEHGPFSDKEIESLLAEGELGEFDFIRTGVDPEWRSFADFFGQIPQRPDAEPEPIPTYEIAARSAPAVSVRKSVAPVIVYREMPRERGLARGILIGGVAGMVLAFGAVCVYVYYQKNSQTFAEASHPSPSAVHAMPNGSPSPVARSSPPSGTALASGDTPAATAAPASQLAVETAKPDALAPPVVASSMLPSTPSGPAQELSAATNEAQGPPQPATPAPTPKAPPLVKGRSISLSPTAQGDNANLWVADTSQNPRAVLVICVDKHPQFVVSDPVWQKFASDNGLDLAGVSFSSDRKLQKAGGGFIQVEKGSGNLLLNGLDQGFGKSLPIILYGGGGTGTYVANFAGWQQGRLMLWAAYTNYFQAKVAVDGNTPAIIACDQDVPGGVTLANQLFAQGRVQNKPWTLLRMTAAKQDRWPQLDNFVRDYITALLTRSGGNSAAGNVWVDNQLRRGLSTTELFAHPERGSWLPNADTFRDWMNLTADTVANAAPIVIERDIATKNPAQPILKLFLRLPPGAPDGRGVNGVLAYCTWENNEGAILSKLTGQAKGKRTTPTEALMLPFLDFADQHNMAVLTWGTVDAWNNTVNTEEMAHREQEEFDRNFDLLADAWGRGVAQLGQETGIPQKDYLLYGISRGAQWAHRLALRKPDYFLAVHIHIPSTFDTPTATGNQTLWLVTTGEQEYGYERAQQFYHECRALGYPIIFKAIIGLGHADSSIEHALGFKFFEYALSVRAARDSWLEAMNNPFRSRLSQSWPPETWLAAFRAPPFYGDFLNQDCYPANQIDMIPVVLRVPLPTKELAELWNK